MKIISLEERKKNLEVKLCKDCEHFRPDKSFIFWFTNARYRYAKCSVSLTDKDDDLTYITGIKPNKENWSYCSIQRDPQFSSLAKMCGPEGRKFVAKKKT